MRRNRSRVYIADINDSVTKNLSKKGKNKAVIDNRVEDKEAKTDGDETRSQLSKRQLMRFFL